MRKHRPRRNWRYNREHTHYLVPSDNPNRMYYFVCGARRHPHSKYESGELKENEWAIRWSKANSLRCVDCSRCKKSKLYQTALANAVLDEELVK